MDSRGRTLDPETLQRRSTVANSLSLPSEATEPRPNATIASRISMKPRRSSAGATVACLSRLRRAGCSDFRNSESKNTSSVDVTSDLSSARLVETQSEKMQIAPV